MYLSKHHSKLSIIANNYLDSLQNTVTADKTWISSVWSLKYTTVLNTEVANVASSHQLQEVKWYWKYFWHKGQQEI
jgi:hypothetical protein